MANLMVGDSVQRSGDWTASELHPPEVRGHGMTHRSVSDILGVLSLVASVAGVSLFFLSSAINQVSISFVAVTFSGIAAGLALTRVYKTKDSDQGKSNTAQSGRIRAVLG